MFHVQLLSVIYYVFLDSPILYSIKRLGYAAAYAIILSLVPCQVSGKLDLGHPVSQYG
jgi:hypothetical protein